MRAQETQLIRSKRILCRVSAEQAADALGMTTGTYYKKERRPVLFTVGEIRILLRLLHLDSDELSQLIKG